MSRFENFPLSVVLIFTAAIILAVSCEGPAGPPGSTGDPGILWRGEWSPNIAYRLDDAVAHEGSAYVCKKANTGIEPPNVSFWDLLAEEGATGDRGEQGKPGLSWRGDWVSTTLYGVNDVVHHEGSAWVCIASHQNQAPPGSNWRPLALKGTDGKWDGGRVPNRAFFDGGAEFSGADTKFHAETIFLANTSFNRELECLSAITVPDNQSGTKAYLSARSFEFGSGTLNYVFVDGDNTPEVALESSGGGSAALRASGAAANGSSELVLKSASARSTAARMSARADYGGGGRLQLYNAQGMLVIDLDANTGTLRLFNASGQATIEMDAQSGNIYYTGKFANR